MHLRKYHARSMPEALARMKAELGPDAVIVATRQRRRFGFWGAPALELTAGVDPPAAVAARPAERAVAAPAARAAPVVPTATRPQPAPVAAAAYAGARVDAGTWGRGDAETRGRADAQTRGRADTGTRRHGDAATTFPAPPPRPGAADGVWGSAGKGEAPGRSASSPDAAGVATLAALETMRRELSTLRGTVERLVHEREIPTYRPAVQELVRSLADHDLAPKLAAQVGAAVERELSDAALANPAALRDAVRREIERLVPTRDPLSEPGRRVLFLIGPTGVGKTTTLAKLAAAFVLLGRGPVALITADTFRIAAIPQLRTYADIISVPLDVAYAPEDLRALLAQHADKALVLIDTPGRSQHSTAQLAELRAYVRAAEPCEVLLTVAGNVRQRDLVDVAERFSRVSYDGLVATKLDETRTYGAPLNLAHHIGVPLTYLTTGQNVPQDLAVATAERFCDLLLGEAGPC